MDVKDLDSPEVTETLPPPPPLEGSSVEPVRAPGYVAPAGRSEGGQSSGSSAGGGASAGGGEGPRRSSAQGKGSSGPPAEKKKVVLQAARAGYGRAGRPAQVLCNHFAVKLTNVTDVYHYNVTITPEVPKKVSREVMNKLRATYGAAEFKGKRGAYDGEKSLFTSGPLNFNQQEYPVFLDDERGPSFKPGEQGRRSGDSPQEGSPHAVSPPPGSPEDQGALQKKRRTTGRARDFMVRIDFAAKVNMRAIDDVLRGLPGAQVDRAQDALRVLDIVLRESASSKGYLLVRDNFFHPSLGQLGNLGEGVEAWRGFHSSIRMTKAGLTLNLDTTMTTVIKPIMVEEFLMEKLNLRGGLERMDERGWNKAKGLLKKVKVETIHMRVSRTHTITGFSPRACKDLTFSKKSRQNPGEVEEVSVADYYWEVYKHRLKYPNAPALDVGSKKKPTYIPLELCKIIEGQRYTKALSRMQRTKQIEIGKQSPQDRRHVCEDAMAVNKYDSDELIREFGLNFNPQLLKVTARILDAPTLVFGAGRKENPRDGKWNFNNKQLMQGCNIPNWVVAVFDGRCHDGGNIAQSLVQACNKRGMRLSEPVAVEKEPQNNLHFPAEERVKQMFKLLGRSRPMFILAILPDKDSEIYVPFKKMCEVVVGVASQCMVKPRQLNDQYLGNLALKINLKLGGYNSPLGPEMTTFLGTSTVIFGMDVSHGSPGDVDSPSVAAVVASKDWPKVSGLYSARVRTQPSKMEMIEGLYEEVDGQRGGMVKELLVDFYKSYTGPAIQRKPQQIIVYRDGVSESQFDQCLDLEVTAFLKACEALESGYHPKITFIVAQKRHNTRFFPVPNSPCMNNGNVLPGTIIDKDVCHPTNYDFFLCSHAGLIGTNALNQSMQGADEVSGEVVIVKSLSYILLLMVPEQGTTRPTHYHVLYNENERFTPDDLQQLTNHLCYAFARCTTAVAVAAPAAYAHIVASRFQKLIDMETGSDTASLRSSRSGGAGKPMPSIPAVKMKEKESMFFC